MTCRDFATFLNEYLSGEVDPGARARFEEHLAVCPQCVAYLKTYQETIKLGKAALADPDEPVPSDVPEELVKAILAARAARQR